MAEIFRPQPINGGDPASWGPKEQQQNQLSTGLNTSTIFLDGVTLKLKAGKLGFANGSIASPTAVGVIEIDADKTLSLVGLTASCWAKIEEAISGTVVTTTILSISGATDPAALPSEFTSAYVGLRGGYYIIDGGAYNKRCHGIVWINASGEVEQIINTLGAHENATDQASNLFYTVSKNANYTIPDYAPYSANNDRALNLRILATRGATGFIVTLPAPAANVDRTIEIVVVDDAPGCCLVKPNGAETIGGMPYLFLIEHRQRVTLYCDGTNYQILGGVLYCITGGINTNDWTNRELGMPVIPWDNASGTPPIIGELVTEETSGNTGIVVGFTGAATGTITLMKVTGTGIFSDNKKLTGSWGGGYVTVNIPGSTSKNADSNVIHNFGRNASTIYTETWFSASVIYSSTGATKIQEFADDNGTSRGVSPIQVDVNNVKQQIGADGASIVTENGTRTILTNQDYSYKTIIKAVY